MPQPEANAQDGEADIRILRSKWGSVGGVFNGLLKKAGDRLLLVDP